jgi:putative FmdB family regulatory protein
MPLYEYDCPKCGRFEVLQKMSDPPLSRHFCGSEVKKLMSASSFSFKGSGFYTTDYKKSSSSMHDSSPAPKCDKPKSEACGGCSSNKAA